MKGWVGRATISMVAVVMGNACGSSDEQGSTPFSGDPVPLASLGDVYEAVLCRYLMECGGAAYRTTEECMADRAPSGLADLTAAVSEGRIAYDAAAVGACRAAIEAHICSLPYLFVPTVGEIVDDCLEDQGQQSDGDPCRDDVECAPGLHCLTIDGACPGTCRPLLAEGDPCDVGRCGPPPPFDLTLTRLFALSRAEVEALTEQYEPLDLSCHDGVCEAPIPIGSACTPGADCLDGGYCSEVGTCASPGAVGDPCRAGLETCVDGATCLLGSTSDGVCTKTGAEGDPCMFPSDCEDELSCARSGSALGGVCSAPGGRGAPCEITSDCADDLACRDGACADPAGEGEPCTGSECAEGLTCADNVCASWVHPGEPCSAATGTCLGRCVDGSCIARVEIGGACTTGDDCTTRACAGGACVDDDLCDLGAGGI